MRPLLHGVVLAAIIAGTGWAQTTPDFSGTWTLDEGSSDAPPARPMPAVRAEGPPPPPPPPRQTTLTITQTSAAFRIARTLSNVDGTTVQQSTHTLDGSATTSQMGPILNTTTASWDGVNLILSTVHSASALAVGPASGKVIGSLRETFRLEDGRLVVDSQRSLPGGQSTGRMVYVRIR